MSLSNELLERIIDLKSKQPNMKFRVDSRAVMPGDCWIAMPWVGSRVWHFARDACQRGASLLLIDQVPIEFESENGYLFCVPQTLMVPLLQALAVWYRQQLRHTCVIAITGSVGKTSTKGLLVEMLSSKYQVCCSEDNHNGQWGVALSILNVSLSSQFAVIECGIDRPGGMKPLADMVCPNLSLITQISQAHTDKLTSSVVIAKEKALLYEALGEQGVAFINADDAFSDMFCSITSAVKQVLYSTRFRPEVDYGLHPADSEAGEVLPSSMWGSKESGWVSLVEPAFIFRENQCAAVAIALYLGVRPTAIDQALRSYSGAKGRLQTLIKDGTYWMIDDSYNASPKSMQEAIRFINQANVDNKWLVIGDMLGLGDEGNLWHERVSQWLNEVELRGLITLGSFTKLIHDRYHGAKWHCQNHDQIIAILKKETRIVGMNLIFFKASNAMGFSVLAHAALAVLATETSKMGS